MKKKLQDVTNKPKTKSAYTPHICHYRLLQGGCRLLTINHLPSPTILCMRFCLGKLTFGTPLCKFHLLLFQIEVQWANLMLSLVQFCRLVFAWRNRLIWGSKCNTRQFGLILSGPIAHQFILFNFNNIGRYLIPSPFPLLCFTKTRTGAVRDLLHDLRRLVTLDIYSLLREARLWVLVSHVTSSFQA